MIQSRMPLTDRQMQVYRVIEEYTQRVGYAPSIREIGRIMGIHSPNGVRTHLEALERNGWLVRVKDESGRRVSHAWALVGAEGRRPRYTVEVRECSRGQLVIRDVGHALGMMTLTNGIELVMEELDKAGLLDGSDGSRKKLLYYDSAGDLTQVWCDSKGKLCFKEVPCQSDAAHHQRSEQ